MWRKLRKFFKKKHPQQESYIKTSEWVETAHEQSPGFYAHDRVHGSSGVSSVACAEQDNCLSGAEDGSLVVSNFVSGNVVKKWTGHSRGVTKVACRANLSVSASRDKCVKIWKEDASTPVSECIGHDLVVTGVSLSATGSEAFSGSRDNSVRLWDVKTGTCLRKATLSQNLVTHVKWANGSDIVAQSSEDKMVHVWDCRTMEAVLNTSAKQHIQTCCDLSKDDRYCLSSSNGFAASGCEATLWDLRAVRRPVSEFHGHTETVTSCCFVPDCDRMAVTCSNDRTVKIWNPDTGRCVAESSLSSAAGPLTSVAADMHRHVIVSTMNAGLQLFNLTGSVGAFSLVHTAEL